MRRNKGRRGAMIVRGEENKERRWGTRQKERRDA